MVFCDHYAADLLKSSPAFLRNLLDRGSAGVQLFFILSGFLMVIVYGSRSDAIAKREFYVNRIARIYPAYLFALLISIPLALSWVRSIGIASGLSVPIFVLSKFTMTDGWYLGRCYAETSFNWLQQGWSLSSELFFYLLFPMLLCWIRRLSLAKSIALCAVGLFSSSILVTASGYLFSIDVTFSPPIQLPAFVIGLGMGRIVLEYGPRLATMVWQRYVVVLVTIVYQMITPESQLPQWEFTGLQLCYALLIACLGLEFYQTTTTNHGPLKKFFVVLGETSYSVYLLQTAVYSYLGLVLHKLAIRPLDSPNSWGFFFLTFGATNVVAWLVWRYFEGPARKWIQRRFARKA